MKILLLSFCSLLYSLSCFGQGCLTVGAEWLYFMPSFDQSDYAVKGDPAGTIHTGGGTTNPFTDRHQIDQAFRTGYRLEVDYLSSSCLPDMVARYTRFNQKLESNVSSALLTLSPNWGTAIAINSLNNVLGVIEGKQRFNYYAIEGLIRPYTTGCHCINLELLAGLKYAHINYTEQMDVNAVDSFGNGAGVYIVINRLRSQGIGPEIRLQGSYCFGNCFSLIGEFQVAGIVSSAENKMDEHQRSDNPAQLNDVIKQDPKAYWHLISNYECRLGMKYFPNNSWNCVHLNLEAGYELQRYPHFLKGMGFCDRDIPGFSYNQFSAFTLNGPYFRATVSY